MKKSYLISALSLVFLILSLTACNPSPPVIAPTPSATSSPESQSSSQNAAPAGAATPTVLSSPTATTVPTTTPSPAPTLPPTETATPTLLPAPNISPTPAPGTVFGTISIQIGHRRCVDMVERGGVIARRLFEQVQPAGPGFFYFSYEGQFTHIPLGVEIENIAQIPVDVNLIDLNLISHCVSTAANMHPGTYYLPYHVTVYREQGQITNPSTRQFATEGEGNIRLRVLPPVNPEAGLHDLIAFTARRNLDGDNEPSGTYIFVADAAGTALTHFTGVEAREPAWSPDRTRIAYTALRAGTSAGVYVANLDGSAHQLVSEDGSHPAWSPDGTQLAVYKAGKIHLIDLADLTITELTASREDYSWSPDGDRIVFQLDGQIFTVDVLSSEVTPLTDGNLEAAYPTWSPSGDSIAFVQKRENGTSGLYLINPDGSGLTDLTPGMDLGSILSFARKPDWSPDGRQIVFGDLREIYIVNRDASGLRALAEAESNPFFSPSGTHVAFLWKPDRYNWVNSRHIYTIAIDGSDLNQVSFDDMDISAIINIVW